MLPVVSVAPGARTVVTIPPDTLRITKFSSPRCRGSGAIQRDAIRAVQVAEWRCRHPAVAGCPVPATVVMIPPILCGYDVDGICDVDVPDTIHRYALGSVQEGGVALMLSASVAPPATVVIFPLILFGF